MDKQQLAEIGQKLLDDYNKAQDEAGVKMLYQAVIQDGKIEVIVNVVNAPEKTVEVREDK